MSRRTTGSSKMPTPFHIRKLECSPLHYLSDPGSLPEMRAAESVLVKAFKYDVATAVMLGHAPDKMDSSDNKSIFISILVAGLLAGEVYVAETNDDEHKTVGCAVWFGPGHTMMETEEERKLAMEPFMASFSEELRQWWGTVFLPQYDSLVTSALGAGVKHNSWHLQSLGVDPEFQRQGAAKLLVNVIAEKAKLTGSALCVEASTEMNVEIYNKLGFELMPQGKGGVDDCKYTISGILGTQMPVWVMARKDLTSRRA